MGLCLDLQGEGHEKLRGDEKSLMNRHMKGTQEMVGAGNGHWPRPLESLLPGVSVEGSHRVRTGLSMMGVLTNVSQSHAKISVNSQT